MGNPGSVRIANSFNTPALLSYSVSIGYLPKGSVVIKGSYNKLGPYYLGESLIPKEGDNFGLCSKFEIIKSENNTYLFGVVKNICSNKRVQRDYLWSMCRIKNGSNN